MRKSISILLTAALLASCGPKDGEYVLHVLSTNDVHGCWFDSSYVDGTPKKSLMAMSRTIDSVRTVAGAENVVLVDAGDCLQGDNATYYYNYVDTLSEHLFPRLVSYMKYDAVAVGNHDIETGHPVYDRVTADLARAHSEFLGGNAVRTSDGKPYFQLYKTIRRGGMKIAILGYTNANIKAWLDESLWRGMDFVPIRDIIQRDVDEVRRKERPDVVIATMHSACGRGDGTILEAEALDAFNSVRGVDFLVCGHDHAPVVQARDTSALLNSGSHARYVAHGTLHLSRKGGKVTAKSFDAELIPIRAEAVDTAMRAAFRKEFEAVREFTLTEVGILNSDLVTRDAFAGMCPYINLIHALSLTATGADVSMAAPLTYNGKVASGVLRFNDLFTIYPFENQLFTVEMSGEEICRYLEVSYDRWIRTIASPSDHILRIKQSDDPRTQQRGWSFENRFYNFDSAGGLCYTVDVTKPFGDRVDISTLAGGEAFDPARKYTVAMTSYRACGGGNILLEAGIEPPVTGRYPEVRNLLYDYLMENGSIDPETTGAPGLVGRWRFIPEELAGPAMRRDLALMFGE